MTISQEQIEFLAAECERLGGKLIQKPLGPRDHAPFSYCVGLDWYKREVYLDLKTAEINMRQEVWAELIHEMGHTFACRVVPERANEIKWLGWEFAMQRRMSRRVRGCTFDRWTEYGASYVLGKSITKHYSERGMEVFDAIGDIVKNQLPRLRRDFEGVAAARGLVVDGVPVSVRIGKGRG